MKPKTLLTIISVIFGIIAVMHFLRALFNIPVVFGIWSAPLWLSWIAVVVAGYIAYTCWNAR